MNTQVRPFIDSDPIFNSDAALVIFGSPDDRTLGAASRLKGYHADEVVIFRIVDETNRKRSRNIAELRKKLQKHGRVHVVDTTHADPLVGLDEMQETVGTICKNRNVTIDISTFPRNSLLLTLRSIETISRPRTLQVLYTEPTIYKPTSSHRDSFGMNHISLVPTFTAPFFADQELVLVMLLGYERDRAVGIWQRVQPHRMVVSIGRPSYQPKWEGEVERANAPVLAALSEGDIHYVDPRDPWATCAFMEKVIKYADDGHLDNYYIAPLGPKPQVVGVYLFCRNRPKMASVVYGAPVNPQHQYIAQGIGPTWHLAGWEVP